MTGFGVILMGENGKYGTTMMTENNAEENGSKSKAGITAILLRGSWLQFGFVRQTTLQTIRRNENIRTWDKSCSQKPGAVQVARETIYLEENEDRGTIGEAKEHVSRVTF
jgi:hypothetical protein